MGKQREIIRSAPERHVNRRWRNREWSIGATPYAPLGCQRGAAANTAAGRSFWRELGKIVDSQLLLQLSDLIDDFEEAARSKAAGRS